MGKNSSQDSYSKDQNYYERNRDYDKQRGYRSNSRRSSDYRNEDFNHSQNDYDDDEYSGDNFNKRSYRNQNAHHHHHHHHHHRHKESYQRDRDRRSRSRSYERESTSSSYNRNYDSDNSKNSERYEERDRSYREKAETPNNTLMIRNLPSHILDKDITAEINRLGLFPKDVRLMKNKETGKSRGFAFIEFPSIEQATQLKELAQDYITFDGEHECSLHYSFPKDTVIVEKSAIKNDWSCPKCGINNFKRRDECFKCGTSKTDSPPYDNKGNKSVQHPTNVLLLQNLSPTTNEETVLYEIGNLTSMPIKSIKMVYGSGPFTQTNTCLVELHSVYEATELFNILYSMKEFTIDNHLVSVSYGKRMDINSAANSSGASQNVAMAALAAAQWKNLDDSSKNAGDKSKKSNLGTVTLNGVTYTKYNAPDYNSFQYDATSGFYYDPSSGFHYDSNSQYFYNSQTQKYMYYDTGNQIYITVDSDGKAEANENPSSKASSSKTDDLSQKQTTAIVEDKAKMAKKIAKDMEKWAKTLAQKEKKEAQSKPAVLQTDSSETTAVETPAESLSSNVSFHVFEKQLSNNSNDKNRNTNKETTSNDPFEIIKNEEERLIDHKRLACLLCKRQFNSLDLLVKHQQLSGLHKTNLSVLRRTLLNEEQLEHVEKVERELGYRDRAKERREKFGIDDTPEYPKRKFEASAKESPVVETIPPPPISTDNIGSRMLKAMGWTEGTGLGKSNQGMSDIIHVERRKSGLGLGNQNASFTRESYKDAVRRTALQRFKEMNQNG